MAWERAKWTLRIRRLNGGSNFRIVISSEMPRRYRIQVFCTELSNTLGEQIIWGVWEERTKSPPTDDNDEGDDDKQHISRFREYRLFPWIKEEKSLEEWRYRIYCRIIQQFYFTPKKSLFLGLWFNSYERFIKNLFWFTRFKWTDDSP